MSTSFERNCRDYKAAVRRIGRQFTDPDADWAPVLFFEGRDGRVVVGLAGDLLGSERSKDAVALLVLPTLLRQEGAWMYGLVLSGWMVVETQPCERSDLVPADDPRRVEVVSLQIADRERHDLWTAPILRWELSPPRLGRWSRSSAVGGRFVEALRRAICPQG